MGNVILIEKYLNTETPCIFVNILLINLLHLYVLLINGN